MTTIFLGSSKAAKSQTKLVIDALTSEAVKFLPWWEAFPAGATLLERLNEIHSKVDRALFLFSPESEAVIRKKDKWIPNLNVVFEFGYFYGCLGKEKVAMMKFGEFYLPSDFGGYIHIPGDKRFNRGKSVVINKQTKQAFEKWAQITDAS